MTEMKMFHINKDGVTLHINRVYISEYEKKIRRKRAATLRKFTTRLFRGKPCPYVEGLWCWNKECHSVQCIFAHLVLGQLEDGRWGCWGFHWATGSYKKPRDVENMRKFWYGIPSNSPKTPCPHEP